jgi:DNA-binding transcriptional ArsR family regulator
MALNQAEMFKILGVENRIRIIELLKEKGPLGVNELSETLEITPSAVSQHLKILRHAGFVRNERKGYWVPYKVNEEALEQCQELLSKVCSCGCKGTGLIREGERVFHSTEGRRTWRKSTSSYIKRRKSATKGGEIDVPRKTNAQY